MSHAHTVPKGWTRGEPLEVTEQRRQEWDGHTNRYETACQRFRVGRPLSGLCPVGQGPAMDDIAYILFDGQADLNAFLKWWNE
jgi:hypothetical protein